MKRHTKLRNLATTTLEVAGVAAIVVGIFILLGLGWAAIAGGAALIGISYLVVRG